MLLLQISESKRVFLHCTKPKLISINAPKNRDPAGEMDAEASMHQSVK